jgi:hypothetical protein
MQPSDVLALAADCQEDVHVAKKLRAASKPPSPLHLFVTGGTYEVHRNIGATVTFETFPGKKDLPATVTHAIHLTTVPEFYEFVQEVRGGTWYGVPSTKFIEDSVRYCEKLKQRAVNERVKTACFVSIPSTPGVERDFILATVRYMEGYGKCFAVSDNSAECASQITAWMSATPVHL